VERTRVLLVRHGQSLGNAERRFGGHSPTPLSALGRAQAEATARAIAAEGVTAIFSSDLLPALRERNIGHMEGLTFEEAAERFPEEYAALVRRDFDRALPGGESFRQMLDRAAAELDLAIELHRGGTVAVFSHSGTICILTLHLMGALDAPDLRPVWVASSNCGITRFELQHGGLTRVLAVNDTRHLTGL
jgi:2,3-bisphosphoglycerate-dependent phosphoglycerate mutase